MVKLRTGIGWMLRAKHATPRGVGRLPFGQAGSENVDVRHGVLVPMSDPVSEQPEELVPRPLASHLAARLRELRARRGLTQDQAAKRLGVHESAVSRWESGTRFPTGEDLVALAELFEVSTDDLLGRARQFANAGTALLDMRLLARLAGAANVDEFDRLLMENEEQAVWLPVPDGAVLVPVPEAMRLTRKVADKFPSSKNVNRMFRPRS